MDRRDGPSRDPEHPEGWIEVTGARTNNLRNVSVRIPRGRITAFTGVSGSGKTSLAIDTVHAEAQLRYLEGLTPFVRQYITPRSRPQVDRITGLSTTLAVDQRKLNRNPRSTVATISGSTGTWGCCTRGCRRCCPGPRPASCPPRTSTGSARRAPARSATGPAGR